MTRHYLRLVSRCLAAVARVLAAPLFDPVLLRGRHFDSIRSIGWRWLVRCLWYQRVLGINREASWPVSPWVRVICPKNIQFHPDDMQNFWSTGSYFQASPDAAIRLGRGCYVGPNVGIITSNHLPGQPDKRRPGKDVELGERCWIGMNSVLLPGCRLASGTTIGAGTVLVSGHYDGVVVGVSRQIIIPAPNAAVTTGHS
jgi:acetyltransferase-like isoleucine patch superfamily enzyme